MFKVLTRRATIPLVTVRLLLSPPACGTVEGLAGQRHVHSQVDIWKIPPQPPKNCYKRFLN